MAKKAFGPAKRFGARYGKTVRDKVSKIEREQRKLHKCPYCSYTRVKRIAAGIWQCRKCGSKFTGKAYSPERRKIKVPTGEETALIDKNLLLDEKDIIEKPKEKVEKKERKEDKTPSEEKVEEQKNGQI